MALRRAEDLILAHHDPGVFVDDPGLQSRPGVGMVGFGHIRRNASIAQALRRSALDPVIVMIAEARQAGALPMPGGVDSVTLPALCKGILYDDDCMTGAWDLVKGWSFAQRRGLTDLAQKIGLEARAGRIKLQELALELLNIAVIGLTRQHALDEHGNDESVYLLRMLDQVRMGVNQASLTINHWKGRWNYDVHRLVEGCSYEAEAAF